MEAVLISIRNELRSVTVPLSAHLSQVGQQRKTFLSVGPPETGREPAVREDEGAAGWCLHGYLTYTKQPPPRTLQ